MITSIKVTNQILRLQPRPALLLTVAILLCLAFPLVPNTLAVSPPPDGGYPNGNTAEGDNALFSLTSGAGNTAIGSDVLFSNTTGSDNTATGFFALISNTTGGFNTAAGFEALLDNTTGSGNTAIGFNSLFSNTSANNGTAIGFRTLERNTSGNENTAVGFQVLLANTAGSFNTAIGGGALASNTTGSDNTATGTSALAHNTTGLFNTATGLDALLSNTGGEANTAGGIEALKSNTTGSSNTATGADALLSNTTGDNNTATGTNALISNTVGSNNTAEGDNALSRNISGSYNIALGNSAGSNLTNGHDNIDIGSAGLAGESKTIRIGTKGTQTSTFIAGINGNAVPNGVSVIIGPGGKLGTVVSSARFKEEIKPMAKASEAILKLKPVSFRYKHELDPASIPQFGLVAEQVEKIAPELVARDNEGKPYTVRYDAVNAMLLNEFLKQHGVVQQQQATINDLMTTVAQQEKRIEALTVTVQRVSDQVALSKPAPQLVANP